jgi:Ca2+-binding EF-hand superfamily protein
MEQVRDRVRQVLMARAKTIRGIGRSFNILNSDRDGRRVLDPSEFYHGLNKLGCQLTKEEAIGLMTSLDRNGDGAIDYEELLIMLRGKPNAARQAVIDQAYRKMDRTGDGKITAADLRGHYNTRLNPKVASGHMSEDQMFLEFLQNFGDVDRDGTISKD